MLMPKLIKALLILLHTAVGSCVSVAPTVTPAGKVFVSVVLSVTVKVISTVDVAVVNVVAVPVNVCRVWVTIVCGPKRAVVASTAAV